MKASAQSMSVVRILEPFGLRSFRWMWAAQLIALIGVQSYLIAQSWLVLQSTGSTSALGTLITLVIVSRAVLLPVGGMLSDRLHPRRMLFVSVVLLAGIAMILAQDLLTDTFETWHLAIHAVLFGSLSALCLPAFFAMLPMLVDKERLQSANSLAQITMQVSQFVGPALGGIVITAVGIGRSYEVMALVFATSALLIYCVRTPPISVEQVAIRARASGGMAECIALFRTERQLLSLVLLTMLANLALAGPLQVVLPALVHDSFRTGVNGLGMVLSAFGAGTLAGSLVAGGLSQLANRMRIALAAGATAGVTWALLGAAGSPSTAVAMLAIIGICLGVLNVLFITQVQSLTPEHLLGRVMGVQLFGSMGLQPISVLVAGWTIDGFGVAPVFLAGGLLMAVVCVALVPSWK